MGVVTARAAGVLDVSVCSPPGRDGDVHPTVLGTCRLCGVQSVYRMGGAQAIAALAYGTPMVRPVQVIAGPGNLYVQEAKLQVSHRVGIDGFAGPSDLLVVAAPGADPPPGRAGPGRTGRARGRHAGGRAIGGLAGCSRPSSRSSRRSRQPIRQLEPAACVADPHAGHQQRDRDLQRVRARASAAGGRGGRVARASGERGGLRVRRQRERDRVRRLRGGLKPRAARPGRGPLRFVAVAAPLPPPHGGGTHRRRRGQARRGGRADRPRGGLHIHAESMLARTEPSRPDGPGA